MIEIVKDLCNINLFFQYQRIKKLFHVAYDLVLIKYKENIFITAWILAKEEREKI